MPSQGQGLPDLRKKRVCTDCIWIVLYLVFVAGWCGITYTGIANQQYERITNGVDSEGRICGADGPCKGFPYRYSPVLTEPSFALCVQKCPNENATKPHTAGPTTPGGVIPVCGNTYKVDWKCNSTDRKNVFCLNDDWPTIATNNAVLFNHFCVPVLSDVADAAKTLLPSNASFFTPDNDGLFRVVGGLEQSWKTVLVCLAASVALSFTVLLFLRWCGGLFMFLLILGTWAALLWGGSLAKQKSEDGSYEDNEDIQTGLKITSIVLYVAAAIFFVVAIFMRHTLRLSLKVLKEGTHAVSDMRELLFMPFLKWFLLCILFSSWIFTAICLVASGPFEQHRLPHPVQQGFPTSFMEELTYKSLDVDTTKKTRYLLLYHLYGLFWTANIIVFMGCMIINVAVGFWYFHRHDDNFAAADVAVRRGFTLSFRKHLGSLIFGAAIIAVVEWIRAILTYLQKKAKAAHNRVAEAVLCMMGCCLCCLEKCLKFVLGEAFILQALEGQPFCTSCKDAFSLIYHNAFALGTIHFIGHAAVAFGKVFVTAGTAIFAYYLTTYSGVSHFTTDEPLVPCLVVALLGYFVATTFLTVYAQSINTLLVCFIIEEQRGGQVVHATTSLRSFVEQARSSQLAQKQGLRDGSETQGDDAQRSLIAHEAPSAAAI